MNKKFYFLFFGLLSIASQKGQAQFISGNLAVERLTSPSGSLSSKGTQVYIDQYGTTSGSAIGTATAFPSGGTTAPSSAPFNLVESGTAGSDGFITLDNLASQVCVPGYDGLLNESGITGNSDKQTIGTVSLARVNSTAGECGTALDGNNYRGLASDGTHFWFSGANGLVYASSATATSGTTVTTNNTMGVAIFGGNLYISTQKTDYGSVGIYEFSGLPSASVSNSAITAIITSGDISAPNAFSFTPYGDTCYIADGSAGIIKYTKSGSTWSEAYVLCKTKAQGITVDYSAASPVIYFTSPNGSGNYIYSVADGGTKNATANKIATAASNNTFNGLAFTPTSITTQPLPNTVSGGANATFSITMNACAANTNYSYQWQLSINGGTSWANIGTTGYTATSSGINNNINSLIIASNASGYVSGDQYRCVVTYMGMYKLTSGAVALTVSAPASHPVVSLTAPANNANYTSPATVTITASATDSNGTISKVEFYNGSVLLSTDSTSPYSYNWGSVASGTYQLTAKAYDNHSAVATSTIVTITCTSPAATIDSIKVMAYNILDYGDGCQGTTTTLDGYLNTILGFATPDILSLEKISASDNTALTDVNAVSAIQYAEAPYTNDVNDIYSVLWYNTAKFGYVSTTLLYSYLSDFDLYQLYYKDPALATTHDTTYLYLVVNHTNSGNAPNSDRDKQLKNTLAALKTKFSRLPNVINMGDFNMHDSEDEAGYDSLIAGNDSNYHFFDPVVTPDAIYAYPLLTDSDPGSYAPYLTTSTRESSSIPNSCGTNGGARDWYDRILISSDLVHNSARIAYVSHSLQTIGNDGNRLNISINDSTTNGRNSSAPSNVINALFQFSNKYPMLAKFAITQVAAGDARQANQNGISAASNSNSVLKAYPNPTTSSVTFEFEKNTVASSLLSIYNMQGVSVQQIVLAANTNSVTIDLGYLPAGNYLVNLPGSGHLIICKL